MLEFLRGRASDRRLRLFAVACCRRIWHLLGSTQNDQALDAAAGHADGLVTAERLANLQRTATRWTVWSAAGATAWEAATDTADAAARVAAQEAARQEAAAVVREGGYPDERIAARNAAYADVRRAEQARQCGLLRDIVGDPFRPVPFDPVWRTPTVVQLAQALYAERRLGELGVLADALEEGGCTSAELLEHLRSPAEHAQGCWALDQVLAKG
jgi:hypothetical protein